MNTSFWSLIPSFVLLLFCTIAYILQEQEVHAAEVLYSPFENISYHPGFMLFPFVNWVTVSFLLYVDGAHFYRYQAWWGAESNGKISSTITTIRKKFTSLISTFLPSLSCVLFHFGNLLLPHWTESILDPACGVIIASFFLMNQQLYMLSVGAVVAQPWDSLGKCLWPL